jgi:sarcosine oxidase, subunit beta
MKRYPMSAAATLPRPPLPSDAEIVIIGAGIMGLCSGLHLARAGKEVVVMERGQPWAEASGVNAGSLAVQNKRLPLIPITLEATRVWRRLREELGRDVGYVQCGGLRVATNREEVERLRISAREQSGAGVDVEWVEGATLRSRAPWLSEEVVAATYCAMDGLANPLEAGEALIRSFAEAGGCLVTGAEVRAVTARGSGFRVTTEANAISCQTLIIAAGVWSGKVARLIGIDLPVHLDVNILTVTEPAARVMDLMVTHIRGILTLKQLPNGSCIIGGGWQGIGDLESGRKDFDYESLLHNIRLGALIVPALKDLHVVRNWAGFEGVTPDSLPYFGRLPGLPNAYISACARGGWSIGPVLGKLMDELVRTGKTSFPILEFDPKRVMR